MREAYLVSRVPRRRGIKGVDFFIAGLLRFIRRRYLFSPLCVIAPGSRRVKTCRNTPLVIANLPPAGEAISEIPGIPCIRWGSLPDSARQELRRMPDAPGFTFNLFIKKLLTEKTLFVSFCQVYSQEFRGYAVREVAFEKMPVFLKADS